MKTTGSVAASAVAAVKPVTACAALPARVVDTGRVRFGAGVGILPRKRG